MKLCSFFTLNILTVPRTRYSAFISELLVQPGKILLQIYNLFPGLPVLHLEQADFLGVFSESLGTSSVFCMRFDRCFRRWCGATVINVPG